MPRYIALLRGVNVGGVNLKMNDVAAALSEAGFGAVRTVLASGNIVLEASGDAAAARRTAESVLRATFGYQAWVLVYDVATVRRLIAAYPFEPEPAGYHSYVTFVSDPGVYDELSGLIVPAGSDEKISRGDGVIYWQVRKGNTLDSVVGKTMSNRRYKSSTTTRNLRTLAKVLG